jgi:hypothetical protein
MTVDLYSNIIYLYILSYMSLPPPTTLHTIHIYIHFLYHKPYTGNNTSIRAQAHSNRRHFGWAQTRPKGEQNCPNRA